MLSVANGIAGGLDAAVSKGLPKAKLVKVRNIEPRNDPKAKRTIATYGPYVLVGKGVCISQKLSHKNISLFSFANSNPNRSLPRVHSTLMAKVFWK